MAMSPDQIQTIYARFQDHNPEPKTELQYTNSYTLLVAVTLSAQATDVGVNKATEKLFSMVDTPQKLLDLGEESLLTYIKTIGLYRSKGKNLIKAAQILVDQYQGQVPSTREKLEDLPGVGRKTANVVLNVAFGQPTIPVDTHIFRVANRIGLACGKTPLAVEEQLLKKTPPQYLQHVHHWLILHGRYICKARQPQCARCFINDLCEYPHKVHGKA